MRFRTGMAILLTFALAVTMSLANVEKKEAKETIKAVQVVVSVVTAPGQKATDVALDVDGDYSWDTLVVKPGLKYGTEEYNKARVLALASDAAWTAYKDAKAEKDYEKAESMALYSYVRGWMAWRQACERIGTYGENGYEYDLAGASDEVLAKVQEDLNRAATYVSVAQGSGVTGHEGVDDVTMLADRIASTQDLLAQNEALKAKAKAKAKK